MYACVHKEIIILHILKSWKDLQNTKLLLAFLSQGGITGDCVSHITDFFVWKKFEQLCP